MFKYLSQIWSSADLRKKILFTIGMLVIYRVLAHITVPGANIQALQALSSQNDLLSVFSLLTGGSTENFSIVLMGISPYINASIIIQLLSVVVPKLEALSKEGEAGRRKLNAYTRWLTLPLAFLQSYGMIILMNNLYAQLSIVDTSSFAVMIPVMLTVTAGTLLLVWIGEQISEKGIGNGISMLIFASIISQVPQMIGQGLVLADSDQSRLVPFVAVGILTVALITGVILVNEAQRRVPITYGSAAIKKDESFLPIRINQAGMIPIIFAVAMVSFPSILGQFLVNARSPWLQDLGQTMTTVLTINSPLYIIIYYLLIIAFTYFYVSITFNAEQVAENIQSRGGYIPGVRPGSQTIDYLQKVSTRLTLFGSNFIAFIAVIPILLQYGFDASGTGSVPLLISGAGIIIIVGTVLDLIRQANAQLVMHDYQKFY